MGSCLDDSVARAVLPPVAQTGRRACRRRCRALCPPPRTQEHRSSKKAGCIPGTARRSALSTGRRSCRCTPLRNRCPWPAGRACRCPARIWRRRTHGNRHERPTSPPVRTDYAVGSPVAYSPWAARSETSHAPVLTQAGGSRTQNGFAPAGGPRSPFVHVKNPLLDYFLQCTATNSNNGCQNHQPNAQLENGARCRFWTGLGWPYRNVASYSHTRK